MSLNESKLVCGQFICKKRGISEHNVTVAENTWFSNSHISAAGCILITYSFAVNFTFNQTLRESSILEGQQLSRETVADRFSYCREICIVALDQQLEEEGQIGGIGEIVEIDECKIGRRKFERGRVVEGSWILGMIHRGHPSKYRLEICPNNKRDKTTLINLIKKHVVATTCFSICWDRNPYRLLEGLHQSGKRTICP